MSVSAVAVLVGALCQTPTTTPPTTTPPTSDAPAPTAAVQPLDASAARAARDAALAFLVGRQHADGSWASASMEGLLDSEYSVESYYAWQVGAHELATLALVDVPSTPERDAALHRAVAWLVRARMPLRGSGWDNDAVWAYLYGVVVCTHLASHARLSDDERAQVAERGRAFLACLLRNEAPGGGFAYYDDPPWTRRPKWSTSFCTAAVLPALLEAERLGWLTARAPIERGVAYLRRCALPEGAYEYDLNPVPRISGGEHINRMKGSLGRAQVCNWARRLAGDDTLPADGIHRGLEAFFAEHRFLDVARMRPVPHEAYYRNAGYFYHFGHYYAALAIEQLPPAERDPFRGLLRAHIVKTQRKDGSFSDFIDQEYLLVADTSFCVLALQAGL